MIPSIDVGIPPIAKVLGKEHNMRVVRAKYAIAMASAIGLLAGCAGESSPSVPSSVSQTATAQKASSSQCPCLYVANDDDSITVYAHGASGNVAPIQRLYGSKTRLLDPQGVVVDVNGRIYVANMVGGGPSNPGSISVYAAGATGNVAPIQRISGSDTGLYLPTSVAVDPINGDIYVASSDDYDVTIYSPGSNGNARPIATLNAKYGYGPAFVALDASGNIYVSYGDGANVIQVWAAGSTGNAAPIATISGSKTGLNVPDQLTVDSNGNIYVANDGTPSIAVYAAGKSGDVAPMQTIKGRRTKLHSSGKGGTVGVAVDASDNIYASTYDVLSSKLSGQLNAYAAGSNGNAAPTSEIKGRKTKLAPFGIAIH
jgi:hypothetical protein